MKRRLFTVILCLALLAGQVGMDLPAVAAETSETTEVTAVPETTAAPETTAEPEATAEPEITEEPEATEGPETTADPEATEEPEATADPEATEEPEVTADPEATEEPEASAAPETTAAPCAASVSFGGISQNYETLEAAWAQAVLAPKATVTLLKDVKLTAPLVMSQGKVTFNGGAFTLSAEDMNVFQVMGGKLTIAGGTISTKLSKAKAESYVYDGPEASALSAVAVLAGGTVDVTGGQILGDSDAVRSEGGKVTISGGALAGVHTALRLAAAGEASVSGGSLTGAFAVKTDEGPVAETLEAGSAYASEGGPIAADDLAGTELAGAVTVVKTESQPEDEAAPEAQPDEADGAASVTADGEMSVYASFEEAWMAAKAAPGAVVELLQDQVLAAPLVVEDGEAVTLNGGEFALSYGENEQTDALVRVTAGGELTVAGGVFTSPAESFPAIAVEMGGVMTFAGGMVNSGACGILAAGDVTVTGGTIDGALYAVAAVGEGQSVEPAVGVDVPAAVSEAPHGAVAISGGLLTSGYAALYAEAPQYVTLSGGTYTGSEAAVAVPGALEVDALLAEGYEYKQDGEAVASEEADHLTGSVSVRPIAASPDASVTIAGQSDTYDTIDEAWAAAAAADEATVTLLQDVTVTAPLTVTAGHSVTLNGGSYTLSGTGTSVLSVSGGSLTVSGGTVNGVDYAVRAANGATLTIAGGYITASRYSVTSNQSTLNITGGTVASSYTGVYITGGTAQISGGTITGTAEEAAWGVTVTAGGELTVTAGEIGGAGDGSGAYADGGKITVDGGTIAGGANGLRAVNGGEVTITDGEITGENYGVALADGGIADISGGQIEANCGVRVNGSTAQITGGTITTDTYGVYVSNGEATIDGETVIDSAYNGACLFGGTLEVLNGSIKGVGEETGWGIYVSSGLATVSGGTIEGKRYGIQASDPTTASLGGGTFTGEYAVKTAEDSAVSALLQSGCAYMRDGQQIEDAAVDGLEGTVTVERVGEALAARVTVNGVSTEYATIEEAWAAAKGHTATVQILSNVETDQTLTVGEGDAITLAGPYSLNSTAESALAVTGGTLDLASAVVRGGDYAVNATGGTVSVTGGTISATGTGISAAGATVSISGGTVSGDQYGLVSSNRSTTTLTGGTITSAYNGVFMSSGTLNMAGGAIRCTGASGWAVYARGGKVNVAGGTISGIRYGIMTTLPRYVSITGGTFEGTSAVATAEGTSVRSMLASGYRFMKDGAPVDASGNVLAGTVTAEKDPNATPTPKPTAKPTPTKKPASSGTGTGSGSGSGSSSGTKKSPKTGDETSILPWALMLAASGCGLACVALRRRRNRG